MNSQLHGAVGITREYALHRYTRQLWAQRDADQSEYEWTRRLGAMATAVDEATLWDQLTA
jgi:acyl-CoA dehydrogenase